MRAPSGYLLCATPRTGSTFLCSLLASTGVLGRPESYFREPDEATWASRLGVPTTREGVRDFGEFARAVRDLATTSNGIFGARIMWGSLERVIQGLTTSPEQSGLAVLEAAFGRLAFVHLSRDDIVAQAVSWARAEQTGYWQQGDEVLHSPVMDLRQMEDLANTIAEHNLGWKTWFNQNGVKPARVTYEELAHDPRRAVEHIAAEVEVALPPTWQPASPHRKQGDRTNEEWHAQLRAALAGEVG